MLRKKGPQDPLEPYREAVRTHGAGFDALLWRNRDFQQTRFRVIAEVAADGIRTNQFGRYDPLQGVRLADIGCGNADLYVWLSKAGINVGLYTGVDALPELMQICRQRAAEEGWACAGFEETDFSKDPGLFGRLAQAKNALMVFSGSLNTFPQREAQRRIGEAFEALTRTPGTGVVFNFLSDVSGKRGRAGPAHRFDTVSMIAWAFEQTSKVIVRHDYLGAHDCTIGIFNDYPAD